MLVNDFVQKFVEDKVQNSKLNDHAVSDYLKEKLEIKTYIPFREKRSIVEAIVDQNIEWADGIKKIDDINMYVSFVIAMISAHTSLDFSDDPVADYDLLAESRLLPQIIAEFQESYDECQLLLNLCVKNVLEDNGINVLVSKFLDGILQKLDDVGEILKDKFDNVNIKDVLGKVFKQEDLAKLKGFLDKYNK